MVDIIRDVVRRNRRESTSGERILWEEIRGRKLGGLKFKRQVAIRYHADERSSFFVADFYCAEHRLILEIDGESHNEKEEYDQLRTELLQLAGYHVLRFSNAEIQTALHQVKTKIISQTNP